MKKMKLHCSILLFTAITSTGCQQTNTEKYSLDIALNCKTLANDNIGLHYRLTENDKTQHVTVWRHNQQLLYTYQELALSQGFALAKNQFLYQAQYFDNDLRAIEYEPKRLSKKQAEQRWQQKRDVLSPTLIAQMTTSYQQGKDCQQISAKTLHKDNYNADVIWIESLSAPAQATLSLDSKNITWQLESVTTDAKVVSEQFQLRSQYQTTDFADIGDNESDPFLRKMIHLGFIEHGGSGVYDSNGNSLDTEHHH